MADSTSNLDLISSSQASKEITANALFDSMSQNALFGRRASTTAALTWGMYGGKFGKADGTILEVANATIALTASATNYLLQTDGVVSKVTAAPIGWPGPLAGGANALYEIVCGTASVTSYTDYRTVARGADGAAGTTSPLTTKGDVWVYGAGDDRLAVGSNGQVLTADSGEPLGVKWQSAPFDVHTFYPGVPAASTKLYRGKLARAVVFPANFSGSYFTASANATGSTAFDIQKNGSSVGSCTIGAGGVTPTFASSGGLAVSFAAGDVLMIVAPATPDATLADPAITLSGTR